MLTADQLYKTYRRHANRVQVLNGLDLEVGAGEFVSVVGHSGCGKSTLLHVLGTLDAPDSGAVHLDGNRIDNLPQKQRDALRNQTFSFIFQFYHLLPELTTRENVLAPRFGISQSSRPFARAASTGCKSVTSPVNSTRPWPLRAAEARSTTAEFSSCVGFTE